MQPKKLFLIGFLLSVITLNAQTDLNAYKYVTIPNRFDFQKSDDAYQVNSLLKFLFNKKGFEAFLTNEIFPIDFKTNPCLSLNAKVVDESNMFKTKVFIELYNCQNQLVLKTELGESREKELKKGFQEAVRIAFTTIENMPYKFTDDKRIKDIIVLPEIKNTINEPVKASQEVIQVDEIPVPENNEVAAMTDKKYQEKVIVIAENAAKIKVPSIEGVFASAAKTIAIAKQGNQYIISDKQQNVIGILYPTSQANYFILKWLQSDDNTPKLLFLNEAGDVVIDEKQSVLKYNRM
ncbi:MAG: hypothetical protein KGZ87_06310 [Bacteroidetes bacterium]|nr:hypothetical protein [Bacteroidota bacterium]